MNFKTLATKRLLEEVLVDESLKEEIGNIISDYMKNKFTTSAKEGNYEKAATVYEAVKNIGGNNSLALVSELEKIDQSTKALSKYQTAKINEEEGFSALLNRNHLLATDKFKNAYEAYPEYHSVSEIYRLLSKNKGELDNDLVKREVIRETEVS